MNLDYLNSLSEEIDRELEKKDLNYVRLSKLFNEAVNSVHCDFKSLIPKRERRNIIVSHIGLDANNLRELMVGIIPGKLSKDTQLKISRYINECPFTMTTYDLESAISGRNNFYFREQIA